MSVYRALQATRFLPRLAAAAPYGLSRSSIKFSTVGLLWPLIQLPAFAAQVYFNVTDVPTSNVRVTALLLNSAKWLQCTIGVYGILKDGIFQKNIIEVVRSMDSYDKTSGYANDKNGHRENERVLLWTIVYSAVIVALTIGRFLIWRTHRSFVVAEIVTVQIDNAIFMFVVLTTLLGLRLRHLNSIVEETRVTKVREKGAAWESFDPTNPEYFRELYTSLYATGERLNDHYSDRLFLWSAQALVSFLLEIYGLLTQKVSALFVAATLVRVLPVVMGLLLYCTACQFTAGQARKIISALLEKNIRHTARINRGRREIFTMSFYMALRTFQFSALGFFSVNFSLTYAIVTTTVTYVILCIQTGNG